MSSGHRTILVVAGLLLLPALAEAALVQLPITQVWQHKDTNMWCNVCGAGVAHAVNHATNPPGCGHCGMYCAPASISMYALYRARVGNQTNQDHIYDQGKFTGGEIAGDGILQTHGVGMYDVGVAFGGPGMEVQAAFSWAIAQPQEWGLPNGFAPLTGPQVIANIDHNAPILWCDHNGWPANQSPPPVTQHLDHYGHCKLIAGYNDGNTPANFADDSYLIFDPWPISGSPNWLPAANVLQNWDVYLSDQIAVPVESQTWGAVKRLFD